ncbi:MAG: helix-turn-helix domain-containing protein [Clostridium sp.]|nr:helix-turn-helix domain-containing protein [Clostridium sp.]
MGISYSKLLKICNEKHINSNTMRKEKVIGQASWVSIKNGGHIDTRTIGKLCRFLKCQPGDILEYVEDDKD